MTVMLEPAAADQNRPANPLEPGNSFYLLWMILGFLIVSSVLMVSFGQLGDIFGRVKMYNFGYVIYTIASLVLAVDPLTAQAGAPWLIVGRIFQGIGAAFLIATGGDFFPHLISAPFHAGLTEAFIFAALMCAIAAAASWNRGRKYVHTEPSEVTAEQRR